MKSTIFMKCMLSEDEYFLFETLFSLICSPYSRNKCDICLGFIYSPHWIIYVLFQHLQNLWVLSNKVKINKIDRRSNIYNLEWIYNIKMNRKICWWANNSRTSGPIWPILVLNLCWNSNIVLTARKVWISIEKSLKSAPFC